MAQRITRKDLEVQAAIVAAYSQAAGIIGEDDQIILTKGMGGWSLHYHRAGESGWSGLPFTDSFGSIGDSAREAWQKLHTIAEALGAAMDALGVAHAYPVDAVAAIRGER